MLWHHHDYSTAPVMPVDSSPAIRGRAAIPFVAASAGVATEAEKWPQAATLAGPSVKNMVRLRGATPEELSAAVSANEERSAAIANEHAYMTMGRSARNGNQISEACATSLVFASIQSAAVAASAHSESSHSQGEVHIPESEASEPETTESANSSDIESVSGGREFRSAQRTYIGGTASGGESREDGHGKDGADDGSRHGHAGSSLSEQETRVVEEMEKRDQGFSRKVAGVYAHASGLISPALRGKAFSLAV